MAWKNSGPAIIFRWNAKLTSLLMYKCVSRGYSMLMFKSFSWRKFRMIPREQSKTEQTPLFCPLTNCVSKMPPINIFLLLLKIRLKLLWKNDFTSFFGKFSRKTNVVVLNLHNVLLYGDLFRTLTEIYLSKLIFL